MVTQNQYHMNTINFIALRQTHIYTYTVIVTYKHTYIIMFCNNVPVVVVILMLLTAGIRSVKINEY